MRTEEIRTLFIEFFKEKGHEEIESFSLIPNDDPSLLWINAGVTPLKQYFDGTMKPNNLRMVNAQKCIRTNDIENVGVTARHLTFFEMLGNFSIGDYFKKEAIAYAYEFLTSPKWLGLEKDKLYMTYYPSDEDAKNYWLDLGIEASHVIPLEGNYWEIGEGPCGPDSEIFYDRGASYDKRGIELLINDVDNDRYIEIWNLVFSQYNSIANKSRDEYPELPSKNIDTGMGLERIASIMQGVDSNFSIDIFKQIINEIEKLSNVSYNGQMEFKIIADHIRTLCLAIADYALPANEGRGYVIRRLLRRAVKYGSHLGFNEPFLYELVDVVNQVMPWYDFTDSLGVIKKVIYNEEVKFFKTLESGKERLEQLLANNEISSKDAFVLYDTYGYPIELTQEIAKEHGIEIDLASYNALLEEQKVRSRNARVDEVNFDLQSDIIQNLTVASQFVGYDCLTTTSKVVAIISNNQLVDYASGNVGIVLDETPFYAKSGGQVSDLGTIANYDVNEVIKATNGQHIHFINVATISLNDEVACVVDAQFRNSVTINHSTTHLLNYALRAHFGQHVKQQGSYVTNEYLRFDFNHYDLVSDFDILAVEQLVNDYFNDFVTVDVTTMSIAKAKSKGAQAQFGEKYGDEVRVVTLGDSIELCGGTHINSFAKLEHFAIVSFESKGSGVYRIVATTNHHIEAVLNNEYQVIINDVSELQAKIKNNYEQVSSELKTTFDELNVNLTLTSYQDIINLKAAKQTLSEINKQYQKYLDKTLAKSSIASFDLASHQLECANLNVFIGQLTSFNHQALKEIIDEAIANGSADLLVFANVDKKVVFLAKASQKALDLGLNCGNLVKAAAIISGGNGGGRADFAQAGGKDITKVNESLQKVSQIIESVC